MNLEQDAENMARQSRWERGPWNVHDWLLWNEEEALSWQEAEAAQEATERQQELQRSELVRQENVQAELRDAVVTCAMPAFIYFFFFERAHLFEFKARRAQ